MQKIYAGSAKIVQTNFGEMTKISLHKDDVNKIVKYMKDNNLDWCNLDVKAKQSPEQGKHTHYLEINTWRPEPPQKKSQEPQVKDDGDLPF